MYAKMKGFILSPEKAFSQVKGESLKPSFIYMLVLLLFSSLIVSVVSALLGGGIDVIVPLFLGYYVSGLVGNLAIGLWLYVVVLIFRGRGLTSSLKTVFYGSTPSYLLGWTIIFGGVYLRLLFIAWNFVFYWIGIKKLYSMTGRKAGIVTAISFFIGFAIYIGIVFLIFTYYLPFLFSF